MRIFNKGSYARDMAIILALFAALFLVFLGSRPLSVPDEGRYSEVSREMLVTHNFTTPKVDMVPFLDKPPVYYWLGAGSMKLFGVNKFAIRLPGALCALLGILMIYFACRRIFDRKTGIISAIVLGTSPLYFFAAHYANLDLEVTIFITLSLLSFLVGYVDKSEYRRYWFWGQYAFMALAFLTKGLIGIAFPAMIIGSWILITNNWSLLKKMEIPLGVLIIFLLCAPWVLKVQQENPQFLRYFFYFQQVRRFLLTGYNNQFGFWFYLPIIFAGTLPWSIIAIPGIGKFKTLLKNLSQYFIELFLVLWAVLVIIFFSIPSSKIVGYILPAIPPIAILIARYIATAKSRSNKSWFYANAAAGLFFMILGGTLLYLTKLNQFSDLYNNAAVLNPLAYILLAGGIISIGLLFFRKHLLSLTTWTVISGMILWIVLLGIPAFDKKNVAELANLIKPKLTPNSKVVTYNIYPQDLPIYLQRKIYIVYNWDSPTIVKHDNWARDFYFGYNHNRKKYPWLILPSKFKTFWQNDDKIFVITNKGNFITLRRTLKPTPKVIGTKGDKVLFTKP